jgi:hypothetical protein
VQGSSAYDFFLFWDADWCNHELFDPVACMISPSLSLKYEHLLRILVFFFGYLFSDL